MLTAPSYRIIHLTDLHLPATEEEYSEFEAEDELTHVLEAISKIEADYLVITGDLCRHSGHEETYQYIKMMLDQQPIPYFCLSGNHDDPRILARCLGFGEDLDSEGFLYYERKWHDWSVYFLDTTPGFISDAQLSWIESRISAHTSSHPILIFMHHPPCEVPVWYMEENYPLHNRQDLLSILHQSQQACFVFCGHYHVEFSVSNRNVHTYITPSCYFQIKPFQQEFGRDHRKKAFRVIDIAGHRLRTTVRYYDL